MFYRLVITATKKTSSAIVPSTINVHVCLPSCSFRPWVPDLNLYKSLEPISTSCTQNLLLTLYTVHSQLTLLTHSRLQPIYNKILKCIICKR